MSHWPYPPRGMDQLEGGGGGGGGGAFSHKRELF